MPSLSTKEGKTKLRVAIKEFNDELLNEVKIYAINEQQVIEIDELYDEPIKNFIRKKQCRRRNRVNRGNKRKKKRGLQARLDYARSLYHKRLDMLYKSDLKARKLEKLGVSRARIDEAK